MADLIYCQKEEITPIADAIRELCAVNEEMSLVSMRARIGNAAAAVSEQNELIGQITEALGATPSTEPPSMEGNTELLRELIDIAEDAAGSVTLPELTNEGQAGDLLKGKQLIDGEGNVVVGTVESRTNSNIQLNQDAGVVLVDPGIYKETGYIVLPNPAYATEISDNGGEAKVVVTPNNGFYMKPTIKIEVPLGEYQSDVNYTFDDITLTPHNIRAGYIKNESSVQIAPAVVNEVEAQTDLVKQIIEAIDNLPEQGSGSVGNNTQVTLIYENGTAQELNDIAAFGTKYGQVTQVKVGTTTAWQRDSSILTVIMPETKIWCQNQQDYSYTQTFYTNSPVVYGGVYKIYINNTIVYTGIASREEWDDESYLFIDCGDFYLIANSPGDSSSEFYGGIVGGYDEIYLEIHRIG